MKRIGIAVLLIAVAIFYFIVLGGPVKRTFDFNDCAVSYTHYLSNNAYCNWKTKGHCPTNSFILTNVKRQAGICLCESQSDSEIKSDQMLELITSDPFLKHDYEDFIRGKGVTGYDAKTICEYKDIIFAFYYIE